MSSKIRVVTDSSANFDDTRYIDDFKVSIVPMNIHFGDRVYKDRTEITHDEVFARLKQTHDPLHVTAPSVEDFEQVYQELAQTTDEIIVLVNSQHMSTTYENAQTARSTLLGRCDIAVIDSMTTSLGLGYLVQNVAEAAFAGAELEEVVRVARGIVPRLYSVYYVDTLGFIQKAGLIGETQAIMGTMLNIKPMLTVEDGELIAMEKARSHSQAIDKMVEFASEFTKIEKIGILQTSTRSNDHTRMLQDRLTMEFSRLQYPVMLYEPLLAKSLGPDAMGLAILEGNEDY